MRKIKTASAKPAAKATTAPVAAKPVANVPDRAAIADACRSFVSRFYNQASLSVHTRKPCTAATYAAHIAKPVQKCGPAGTSARDESLLCLIASKADAKTGAFDPVAILADAGVISRLASVGYLTMRGDACTLTDTGAERARVAAKRAA
jgi:hypothetical protein